MGYATAIVAAALEAVAPDTPMVVFIPSDTKEAVAGKTSASKEEVARKVMDYWPDVGKWPGFKLSGDGKKKGDDATDAGAALIAGTKHDVYKALFACR
jgi:Holliday junction resolvasome RuvABC endonuclease subunit